MKDSKINLEEIEKKYGPQLKPSDLYFAVVRITEEDDYYDEEEYDDYDEDEDWEDSEDESCLEDQGQDIEFHIYLAEKKAWDRDKSTCDSPSVGGAFPAYTYVTQLLETIDIWPFFGLTYETYIYQAEDDYIDEEVVDSKLLRLGFLRNTEVEDYFEGLERNPDNLSDDIPSLEDEFWKQMPTGYKEVYENIGKIYHEAKVKKWREEKITYPIEVFLPEDLKDEVVSLIPEEEKFQRWGEKKFNTISISEYNNELNVVIDSCFDCDFLSFPHEACVKILDWMKGFTAETLPLEEA